MTALLLNLVGQTTRPTIPDVGVFAVAAAIIVAGAIGVVVARNPVHSALMLVMTLFGVAVMFVLQQASFLAAVQVIVYAGAIVVLFLFVIMFLGVDREEDIAKEKLRGQRPLAAALVLLAATGMPGMPFVAELSVALLVLLAFLVTGVFLLRIREHFDSLDLSGIEEIERRGR